MTQLLNQHLKYFSLFLLAILLCSIPFYYTVVNKTMIGELDEHNHLLSKEVQHRLTLIASNDAALQQAIFLWNQTQSEGHITTVQTGTVLKDSIYTIIHNRGNMSEEDNKFRGLSTYFPIRGKYYHCTIESNVEDTYEIVGSLVITTIAFLLLLVVGFIILNWRISARIWQPFYHTLEKIKTFDLSNPKDTIEENTNIREFKELNNSINKLMEKNISIFRQQKEFVENASHELQTPLAVIKSKVELLLQNENLSDEQYALSEQINKGLARASRLNRNLLLLSKIENQSFKEDMDIGLASLIKNSIALLSDFFNSKNIHIRTDLDGSATIHAHPGLTEILVNNLLTNAIRHTLANGNITIILEKHSLHITNDGMASLDKTKLFRRFGSVSVASPGSGLGLAIIKQICLRYHWQIEYSFKNSQHNFTVML